MRRVAHPIVPAYCRRCSYPLIGLAEPRCPECGTGFDLTDRRTFRRRPKSPLRRGAAWATIVVLLSMGIGLVPKARRYYAVWQQQRFEEACDAVRAADGDVLTSSPGWASVTTPASMDSVVLLKNFGAMDVQTAARLRPYLRRFPPFNFDLRNRRFEPNAFAQWAGLPNVRTLQSSALTDADIPTIAQFPNLQAVALSGSQISDRAVSSFRGMPNLRCVVLGRTSVSRVAAAQLEGASPRVAVFFPSVDLSAERHPPAFDAVEIEDDNHILHSFLVHRDANGKDLWSTPFAGPPEGRTIADEHRVFQPQDDGIDAYDCNTGQWLWRVRCLAVRNTPYPKACCSSTATNPLGAIGVYALMN
jgi:hypothetical protein